MTLFQSIPPTLETYLSKERTTLDSMKAFAIPTGKGKTKTPSAITCRGRNFRGTTSIAAKNAATLDTYMPQRYNGHPRPILLRIIRFRRQLRDVFIQRLHAFFHQPKALCDIAKGLLVHFFAID